LAPPEISFRARALNAAYGEHQILRDLDFELPARRVTVVLGPGGSGKTTLLRVMNGMDAKPTDLSWDGGALAMEPVRLMAQKPAPSELSLAALLAAGNPPSQDPIVRLRALWEPAPAAAAAVEAVIDQPIAALSRPLQRLAAFTVMIASPAPCLLFDEPEVDLDDETQGFLTSMLRTLRGHRTVLVVTHHLTFARSFAEYAALLVDGEILEAAPAPRFFEAPEHPRTQHYVRMGN
jgi:ABC-type phosphate transport system ATPase subunit